MNKIRGYRPAFVCAEDRSARMAPTISFLEGDLLAVEL
jgi:hypothetical protein